MSLDLLAALGCIVVKGVTDDVANTALTTLPPNPHESTRVTAIVIGEGCYIESSDGSLDRPDGITKTTIDVRSTVVSAAFHLYVFPNGPSPIRVRDHSGVTT